MHTKMGLARKVIGTPVSGLLQAKSCPIKPAGPAMRLTWVSVLSHAVSLLEP